MAVTRATQTNDNSPGGSRTEVIPEITPARFRQIRDAFEGALGLVPGERPAWLRETCRDDSELYDRVEELLLADRLAGEEPELTLTLAS